MLELRRLLAGVIDIEIGTNSTCMRVHNTDPVVAVRALKRQFYSGGLVNEECVTCPKIADHHRSSSSPTTTSTTFYTAPEEALITVKDCAPGFCATSSVLTATGSITCPNSMPTSTWVQRTCFAGGPCTSYAPGWKECPPEQEQTVPKWRDKADLFAELMEIFGDAWPTPLGDV